MASKVTDHEAPVTASSGLRPKQIAEITFWNSTDDKNKEAYGLWAGSYDEDMSRKQYKAPTFLAKAFDKAVQQRVPEMSKQELSILEVGPGTGLFGHQLVELGYSNLIGLDMTKEMLEIAATKNIYKDLIWDSVLNWRDHFLPGQFDAVVGCNIFTPGQLKPCAIKELMSLAGAGGVLALTVREDAYETKEFGYSDEFARLEEEKKLDLICRDRVVRYDDPRVSEYSYSHTYVIIHQVLS